MNPNQFRAHLIRTAKKKEQYRNYLEDLLLKKYSRKAKLHKYGIRRKKKDPTIKELIEGVHALGRGYGVNRHNPVGGFPASGGLRVGGMSVGGLSVGGNKLDDIREMYGGMTVGGSKYGGLYVGGSPYQYNPDIHRPMGVKHLNPHSSSMSEHVMSPRYLNNHVPRISSVLENTWR